MKILNFFFLNVLLVSLCQLGICQNKQHPNILFILSDDQSVPHLSCYGDPNIKTPNIDEIANNGIKFMQMYTSTSQCVPSRASLMTGRNPIDIRMTRFSSPLPKEIITLPEMLRAHGYYTGIMGRSFHLDGSHQKSEEAEEVFKKYKLETFQDRVNFLIREEPDNEDLGSFQTFLNGAPKNKPFFLWLNYHNPHRPHTAPANFNPDPSSLVLPPDFPNTKELRNDLSRYYGEVQQLDMYVGLVLKDLKKRGLMDNTLVVFMGDNGASLLRGKGTLYQMGLHVPIVMCWGNKIKKGSISDDLLSGDDLTPTLLDIAGIKSGSQMTGKSFKPVIFHEKYIPHQYVFAQRGAHGDALPNSTAAFDLSRCVISKRYKLIYNALPKLTYSPVDFSGQPFWKELVNMDKNDQLDEKFKNLLFKKVRPMFELYDLVNDPYETNNLYDKPEVATTQKDLARALNEWQIISHDFVPLPIDISKEKKAKQKETAIE